MEIKNSAHFGVSINCRGPKMGTGDDLDPMPDWLLEAAVKVSRKLGIEQNWFNDAAKAVAAMGLPDGILSRADPIEFGKKLTVLVASRSDLI